MASASHANAHNHPTSIGDHRLQYAPTAPGGMNGAHRTNRFPIQLHFRERVVLPASWAGPGPVAIARDSAEPAPEGHNESALPRANDDAPTPRPDVEATPAASGLPTPRPGPTRRFRPLTLSEMADLPPPEWLIEELVPEDGLVVLYGEPAAGKSFLALDWGLSVAAGTPWLGHEVRQGEVVYIYAEGVRGLGRRAEAWMREHQRDDAPGFRAVPLAVAISDAGELGEFVRAVRSVSKRPRLIIIDTLARNFGAGNESLAQDMNAFVRGCDDLRAAFRGATVIVVHHPGKDQKKGARGSLALKGAADAEFALTRSGDTIKLTNEKQKDGEEAVPIALELARVKLPDGNTSRVVRPGNGSAMGKVSAEPRKDPRIVKTDTGVLAALAEFGPGGATLAQWERAAGRANDTFYKSRDRLVEAGKVIHDAENARYLAAEPKAGSGPGSVQNGSNWSPVQKVSPVVPP